MVGVLRAVYSIKADLPLKPYSRRMALAAIHKGVWQAERPAWVNPSRVADGWWVGEDDYGRALACPFVVLDGLAVPTLVLRKRPRGRLA